jgi:two-component system response regulator LytT
MNILIVEDEELAVKKLQKTLGTVDEEASVVGVTGSIEGTVDWLNNHETPDVILMDIELADGQSFEIFNRTDVKSTVIFTTSYDEYAIKAFKVNSIDYLLKPIQKEDLAAALDKYRNLKSLYANNFPAASMDMENLVKELQQQLNPKEFRKRFLVKHLNKLLSIEVSDIAYFYSDDRLNIFKSNDGQKFIVDYTMDEIEQMLDPLQYFRISRAFIVSINSVNQIQDYFGNRLILILRPPSEKEAIVSREKVSDFKKWMGK